MEENRFQSYSFNEEKAAPSREYFSGANVRVYFGDVWIDQLAEISFALEENVAPIFGFRSYTFDKISRGSRQVQGEFVLHFTENGYLQSILERIASGMEKEKTAVSPTVPTPSRAGSEEKNIQDLLAMNDGTGGAYQDLVDSLRNSFWGNPSSFAPSAQKKEQDVFYYKDRDGETNPLREHGFNVLIDYSPDANQKDFQACLTGLKRDKSFYQSYRTLVGVHILGEQQVIANNGEPIQTRYRFIARDLDGDITRPSLWNNYRNTNPTVVEWSSGGGSPSSGGSRVPVHQQS